eukprot:jgi/Botrbrau1/19404/Bobra.0338s0031.1
MASANTLFKSHEEYRRNKELEEARKAGIAPAAVDEEGKEINPHIPQYMSSAPWYLNNDQPSLKHQKDWRQQQQDQIGKHYDRGRKVFQAKKYRAGACPNCGALTHKLKDCLERPRNKGAKWTNKEIAADELIETVQLSSYDARRDRWNGYDASEYVRVIDRHEKVEDAKREAKRQQELERRFNKEGDASDDSDVDEDKILDEEEAGFAKVEKRVRTTAGGASGSVRNLRIREDTAKYLLNLDLNSAHYDPKSRSMREDPLPNKPLKDKTFAGDNFVRQNGDYHEWEALTVHAFAAADRGQNIHMQGAPSQAEALHKQFLSKKQVLEVKSKEAVKEKYGNAAKVVDEKAAALLFGQSERYVEYNAQGRLIKGQQQIARSRYEEDVHPGNHTSVWGSFWKDGSWGYACCHQLARNSYCLGEAGRAAAESVAQQLASNLEQKAREMENRASGANGAIEAHKPRADVWGSEVAGDIKLDEEKLAVAIKAQEAWKQEEVELDDRKRKYNSTRDTGEMTAEEMEAYRLKRARDDDPLEQMKKGSTKGYDFV